MSSSGATNGHDHRFHESAPAPDPPLPTPPPPPPPPTIEEPASPRCASSGTDAEIMRRPPTKLPLRDRLKPVPSSDRVGVLMPDCEWGVAGVDSAEDNNICCPLCQLPLWP